MFPSSFGLGHFICLYLADAKCFVSFLAGLVEAKVEVVVSGFGFRVRGFMLMLVLLGVPIWPVGVFPTPPPSHPPSNLSSGFVLSCVLFM